MPTLGNEDSYCGDYRIEPDGPFLSHVRRDLGSALGIELDRDAFRATFSRGGYFTISLPGNAASSG